MKISVKLSRPQLLKLLKGRMFQMKHHQLLGGPHVLNLHHENMKKVQKAIKGKKGVRLQLSDYEIEGSGLKDVLKKGVRLAKDVIKSDIYQKNLKPLVHKGLDLGIDYLLPASVAGPAKAAVSIIQKKTGLGLKKRGRPRKSRVSKQAMCQEDGDYSIRRKNLKGGSFRAV